MGEVSKTNNLLYFIKWLMQPGIFGRINIYVRNDHSGFDEEKDDVILTIHIDNSISAIKYSFNSNLECINGNIDYNLLRDKYVKGRRTLVKKRYLVKELAVIVNMIKLQRMYNDTNNSVMLVRYSKSMMQSFAFALKISNGLDQRYVKFFYKDVVNEYPFVIIGERLTNGRGQCERIISRQDYIERNPSIQTSVEDYFEFLCEELEKVVGGVTNNDTRF